MNSSVCFFFGDNRLEGLELLVEGVHLEHEFGVAPLVNLQRAHFLVQFGVLIANLLQVLARLRHRQTGNVFSRRHQHDGQRHEHQRLDVPGSFFEGDGHFPL